MRRTTLLLTLALVFLSFGYTVNRKAADAVSKIYLIGNTLIRTTPDQDIRFYDISNLASTRQTAVIPITGNHDVAAAGNYMYADHDADLIIYDISNVAAPVALDTIRNIFTRYYLYDRTNMPIDSMPMETGFRGCSGCFTVDNVTAPTTADAGNSKGTGGSLARFVIVGNYLYCIDATTLKVFDISDPQRPQYKNAVDIAWNIETIFYDQHHLFIGGSQGVYIYDITDQGAPVRDSDLNHVNSCDPVVVEGTRAYVTLRGGSACDGFTNELEILDISDLHAPRVIATVPMTGPYGLAVRDSMVVVCDGSAGVKVLDARNIGNIHQVAGISGITAQDVIWHDATLIVTAAEGFYLYDASDITSPKGYGKLP